MKNLYIVGNWKENKTVQETLDFLSDFSKVYQARPDVKVVICPPYLVVGAVSEFIKSNNISAEIGVQDVSEFEEGAHTGEISAYEVAEFADFSIIGHSERRALGETDDDVQKKVEMALKNKIEPIVCVVNENIPVPAGARMIAYEPVGAIGTGNPDIPENAERIAKSIKEKNANVTHVLYGGSVTQENVRNFTNMPNISGVLVGDASLDPHEFSELIKNA